MADDGSGAGLDGRHTGKYRRAYEFMVSSRHVLLRCQSVGPSSPCKRPCAVADFGCACCWRAGYSAYKCGVLLILGMLCWLAQKKHPYKMREVMSLRSMARGSGLTVGTGSIVLYALFVSVQLRRKVGPPSNAEIPLGVASYATDPLWLDRQITTCTLLRPCRLRSSYSGLSWKASSGT